MKQEKEKVGLLSIIDNLLWAGIGALLVVVLYLDTTTLMKTIYIVAIVVFAIVYMWFVYVKATNNLVIAKASGQSMSSSQVKASKAQIRKISLLNEERQILKQWELTGRAGLVIGKNSENNQVDIDLSDTQLSALISEEHAVLNYTGNSWFVEDFDSEQGTGVQKFMEHNITYLNKSEPMALEPGDYIYVGKTMLQVE